MTDSPVNNPLTRPSPNRLSGRDPESTPHRLSNPVPGSIPHRRTGEGRYPGDGRGNPHNRHPPPTPHFPTTVVPAKAGTQGTGAATTQPSSPTLTGHPPPTVFRRRPEPRGPGSREYLSPILSASNSPLTSSFEPDMTDRSHAQRRVTPTPAATCEGSPPHAAAIASSRTPCTRLRRCTRPRVSRSLSRGVRETDRAPLQESRSRS